MADIITPLKALVEFVLEEKGVSLERAKEKAPITGQTGTGDYISKERYEVASTTVVNRVTSTADPAVYVDVKEKTVIDMASSKGGIERDHYTAVNP